jgi:hypothetical protein
MRCCAALKIAMNSPRSNEPKSAWKFAAQQREVRMEVRRVAAL